MNEPPGAPEPQKPSKSDLARAELVPLAEGERPWVVTVCALLAFAIGVANLVAFGLLVADGRGATAVGAALFGVIMLAVGRALWQSVYWAVVGFQALLVVVILFTFLRLVLANDALEALLDVALLVVASVLFWFMVKAMARIQMPRSD